MNQLQRTMEFMEDMERPGFFKDYHKVVRKSVTNDQFNEFFKLKTDEDRVRFMFKLPAVHEIDIKSYYKGKSEREALERKEAGNKAFGRKDNLEALKLYSQAVVKAPVPSGKYWKLIKENADPKKMTLYAICLANRSAALYHLKDYYHCIRDIDEALEHHYPKELKYKLYKRKGKLLSLYKRHIDARDSLRQALKWVDWAKMEREKRIDQQTDIQKWLRLFESSKTLKNAPWEEVELLPPTPTLAAGQNENFPALSSKVSIQYTSDKGRFITAKEDIHPGDTICVEKPYSSVLLYDQFGTHCQNCFVLTKAPLPCKNCSAALFCSVECRSASYFHKIECPIQDLLQGSGMSSNCFLALRILTQTPLSYFIEQKDNLVDRDLREVCDQSTIYKGNDFFRLFNLIRLQENRTPEDYFHRSLMAAFMVKALKRTKYYSDCKNLKFLPPSAMFWKTIRLDNLSDTEAFVGGLLLRFLQIVQFNAHEVSEFHMQAHNTLEGSANKSLGSAIYCSLSLFNHSCQTVQVRYFSGNQVITKAIKNIAVGEEVNENYGQSYVLQQKSKRRVLLADRYWFNCECEVCREDWPIFDNMDSNFLKFKCHECKSAILLNVNAQTPFAQCQKCNKQTNVLGALKTIQESEQSFRSACKEMDSYNLRKAEHFLVENINQLDASLCLPYKDYPISQEKLIKCYLSQGNIRVSSQHMKNAK